MSDNKSITTAIINEVKKAKLKFILNHLIKESLEEIKEENKKTCNEMIANLETEVQKTYKDFCIEANGAGWYTLNGCPKHNLKLRHLYEDRFNLEYFKDGSDRTKKCNIKFEELKEFVKTVLSKKENYVQSAYNKSVENSKPNKGKDESGPLKPSPKAEDAVTKKEDLPTAPMREVDSFKKQSEHPKEGTKQKYTYPKQKDKKLVVKQKSKKFRSIKNKK